jgi:serine phosphatase RsbU (regulator of sigma subunit)
MILLPTNGIVESRNAVGEPFGTASCLSLIHQLRERTAKEILERLLETVHQFTAGAAQLDDLTAVLIKVGGG